MFAVETPPFVAVRLPRSLFQVCLFVVLGAALQLITVKCRSESMRGGKKTVGWEILKTRAFPFLTGREKNLFGYRLGCNELSWSASGSMAELLDF